MTYTELTLCALVLVVACDRWVLRTRLTSRRSFWLSYAILLFFQLISNGVLTGAQVVRYNPHAILGLRLAYAPVEDVGFGFALILLSLSCWVRLTAAARSGRP
jgi:lycopene cyclase domain-containing protein